MIIAKYPIVHAQKTLIKTTIQKMNDPESGVITISLKKRRQIRKIDSINIKFPKRLIQGERNLLTFKEGVRINRKNEGRDLKEKQQGF